MPSLSATKQSAGDISMLIAYIQAQQQNIDP